LKKRARFTDCSKECPISARSSSRRFFRPALESLECRLPPTVTLSISDPLPFPKPDTGQLTGMFVVTRSGDLAPAVQVDYATQDGTGPNGAHAGTDYVATSGTLNFAANQTTATISVQVVGNTIFQADKTFTVSVSNPSGGSFGFNLPVGFGTGPNPFFVAVADFNGDGKPDLVVVNETSVSVLINTTPTGASIPTFAPRNDFNNGAPQSGPMSVVVADLNGDGKTDLIIENADYTISVLLNTTLTGAGYASFAAPQVFNVGFTYDLAVGDFNADGKPDLAIIPESANNTVLVLLNTTPTGATTVSFAPPQSFAVGHNVHYLAVADFNGDGKPDLAATSFDDNTVSVLLNTTPPGATTLSFAPPQSFATGTQPGRLAVGDFNGDGKPDLAVLEGNPGGTTVSVLLNTTPTGATTPSFAAQQPFAVSGNPFTYSMAVGDLTGDGKPDLAFADGSSTVSVLRNTTPAGATTVSFAPEQSFPAYNNAWSVAVGDFNGDRLTDLAATNHMFNGTVSVLLNTSETISISGSPGTGTISSAPEAPTSLTVVSGNGQSATVTTPFPANLAVDVRDAGGFLVQNVTVIFAVPGGGPSGTFGGNAIVTTDASGRAMAPVLTATTVAGSYTAVAVATQGSEPIFVSFGLRNTAAAAVAFSFTLPGSVQPGVPFSVTVSAVDPYGNIDTNYVTDPSGAVTFYTTTDPDPGVMLPAPYQFTANDAGVHTFVSVVYVTPGAQDINAYDTASGLYGNATVNVSAGPSPSPRGGRVGAPDEAAVSSLFASDRRPWRDAWAWASPLNALDWGQHRAAQRVGADVLLRWLGDPGR
jgi:hypothetical protein